MPLLTVDSAMVEVPALLRDGRPVIVPLPSPLPYVVVGREPHAVNEAKGRPAQQSVGVALRHMDVVRGALDVPGDTFALVAWLCEQELLSVLAPVAPAPPEWLRPAVQDGQAFLAAAWLPELRGLLDPFDHIYMSSANRTGDAPALTSREAADQFGGEVVIVDGDPFRAPGVDHGSTTMVQVAGTGRMVIRRHGINDASFAGDDTAYLRDLEWRFADRQRT